MSSFLVGTNIVPPRPKEQARYSVRELLILGLTLPIRFCPISKFGPEALALEIVSLERMNESLMQYEREQMRQWQFAHAQAKRRLFIAAKERDKREQRESARTGEGGGDGQDEEMEGEGDRTLVLRTLDDGMSGGRSSSSHLDYRRPSRQDSLHFQFPPNHGAGPFNINIGLSLDYTTHRPSVHATLQESDGPSSSTGQSTRYAWKKQQPQTSASLSTYLKDAPTPSKPSPSPEQSSIPETVFQTTPTMSHTVPDMLRSHGGDTPNSMAVERATEPSLRSYSPTSSIRAASDADFNDAASGGLAFSPSHSLNFATVGAPSTPMTESVATLVPFESPQGTLVDSPAREKETSHNEASEDYVVVSGSSSTVPSESAGVDKPSTSTASTASVAPSSIAPSGSGKTFLSRGRIDAKAQDDFIAFMMGKK